MAKKKDDQKPSADTAGEMRRNVPEPPRGWQLVKWYGPGLLWMLSSVGSGSVLFTPRVGSRYGYGLLWAALVVIFFQWVAIKEVGRYTVVSGKTLLDGYKELPGPKGWAVWLIFIPQLFAAAVTIAGIAALAGSALMIAFPGSQLLYATALILVCILLVVIGKYKGVERGSTLLSLILIAAAVSAAVVVFPPLANLSTGLVPGVPDRFDIYFIIPWLGFILAGAIGIVWFSYWTAERGYGGEVTSGRRETEKELPAEEKVRRLKKWLTVMSTTAAIGVIGGGLVIISFLILGTEILRPQNIVPEGIDVARDLTRLLSQVWGQWGYWILLLGIFIALFGTVLADQDGWGRTFADATLILLPPKLKKQTVSASKGWKKYLGKIFSDRVKLKDYYAVLVTAVIPLIIIYVVSKPVDILSVAGTIAAIHTPVVIFITVYLNKKKLPPALQPGWFMVFAMLLAGTFFTVVAVIYFLRLFGISLG